MRLLKSVEQWKTPVGLEDIFVFEALTFDRKMA